MSIGSDIRDKRPLEDSSGAQSTIFSSGSIPYLLSTADGLIILLSSLVGGIGYHLLVQNPIPSVPPYCAVGLLASLIYVLRMNGNGYYDFPESAKPRVEFAEILVCWFTTGLLLALFAFLLKVGVDYSRGSFVGFFFLRLSACSVSARLRKSLWLKRYHAEGSVGATPCWLANSARWPRWNHKICSPFLVQPKSTDLPWVERVIRQCVHRQTCGLLIPSQTLCGVIIAKRSCLLCLGTTLTGLSSCESKSRVFL